MSTGNGAGPLVPTFHGFVHNSMDGLVLFEACLSGKLHHVPRRPHDRERSSLIKSGSIFIYEENASGIKRWTDGVAWSPSRILGNFLIYRELEKPFPPGEKKRAMKRKRASMPREQYPRANSDDNGHNDLANPLTPPETNHSGDIKSEVPSTDQDKELERSLIGSLVDSYGFRPDGLVKKTMSISVNGISHHMVSYYKVEDVKQGNLPRPISDSRLSGISVRPELYLKQNFRAPVEETEQYALDGHGQAYSQMIYSSMAPGGYGVRPGQYMAQPQSFPVYSVAPVTSYSSFPPTTGTSWPPQQASAGSLPFAGQTGYGSQYSTSSFYKTQAPGNAPLKSEDSPATSQQPSYSNLYAPPYSNAGRNGSQHSQLMQSAYQTPTQSAASFGAMSAHGDRTSYSARPPYVANSMPIPTTNGQSQHGYPHASATTYAVRSPVQNLPIQSAPNSAVATSPHPSMKSPMLSNSGGPGVGPASHLSYSRSYSVQTPQSAHPSGVMNGLGVSGHANYSGQQQSGHSSYGYAQAGGQYSP